MSVLGLDVTGRAAIAVGVGLSLTAVGALCLWVRRRISVSRAIGILASSALWALLVLAGAWGL